jgi:two-component system NtrC family response regulator
MTKPALLIVEDDEDIRAQMKWALASDYDIALAADRVGALAVFADLHPAVTILDLGLPPRPNDTTEGLATLEQILSRDSSARVIVATGQGEKQNALDAIGAGACDFFVKPVDLDALRLLLQRHVHVRELEQEHRAAQQEQIAPVFEGMLGASPPMSSVFTAIRKVGPTTAPVLILGESGTGKEMVAQALHHHSPLRGGPFVALNCSAIPDNLLESELFGHERGAFTGAHAMRKGHIESAGGGTLFLDEIGDLPASLQVKLLRFLQEKTFQRVGGRQEIASDTRVVAATNANLADAVAKGAFREDLYFRLAVVVVKVPPLRERGDDVTLLAKEFLRRCGIEYGKPKMTFAADALRALGLHAWPGNVREMQNRIRRAAIMADGKRVTSDDLELAEVFSMTHPSTLKEVRESTERELVQQALRRHQGKISAAALELGISRPTLYELIDKLGIVKSESRPKASNGSM